MKTQDLLKALTIVKPGLGSKELIEQSTSFAFIDGFVITYNDEVSISHPVEGIELTGAIKAEELYQFLNKTKEEEIAISKNKKETEIVIKAGKSKASFTLQDEIKLDLSQFEGKKKWKKVSSEFIDALLFVSVGCSKDASTPAMTCVHVTNGFVEATDRFRVVRHKTETEFDFLLPSDSISTVRNINPTKICIEKQWVHFKNEENTILSCRIFAAEFPKIDPFFTVDGIELKLPSKLKEIVERGSIFAKRDYSYDEFLIITIADKQMTINAVCDSASFEESTVIKYKGPEITFRIIPQLLKDIIDQKDSVITLSQNKIKFETDKWEYVAVLTENK